MNPRELKLSVNVDHVATLRQARGTTYPDPLEAARLAEEAGASGITVHLRADRRHIQDDDVERLRAAVRGKLNLEMAATDEMVEIARRLRPHQVTLVPERPEEVTTEGGLDLSAAQARLLAAAERLRADDIAVSLFVDPDDATLAAIERFAGLAEGFEINTDAYTRATGGFAATHRAAAARAAAVGASRGFRVYAGHGLTAANVGGIASIPQIEELNIGHSLVARAVMVGLPAAIGEMLASMRSARTGRRPSP